MDNSEIILFLSSSGISANDSLLYFFIVSIALFIELIKFALFMDSFNESIELLNFSCSIDNFLNLFFILLKISKI